MSKLMILTTTHSQSTIVFNGTNDYASSAFPIVYTDIASNDFTIEARLKPNGITL